MSELAGRFYAKAIINGQRTFSDCPTKLKEDVKKALIDMGREDLIVEESEEESPIDSN